ncbi:MAG: hypothetical protein GSR80_001681 [Desulfurococcales archaeon]|nr:hypothetical protein [Desulfurococcales archaeon]
MKVPLRLSVIACLMVILAYPSMLLPLETHSATNLYWTKTYSQDCIRVVIYTYATGLHKIVIAPTNLSDCVYIGYLRIDGSTVELNRSTCGGALVIDERYEPYLFPRGPGVVAISYSVRRHGVALCRGILNLEIGQPNTVATPQSGAPGIREAPGAKRYSAGQEYVEPVSERVTGPSGVWILVLLAAAWALAVLVRACGV